MSVVGQPYISSSVFGIEADANTIRIDGSTTITAYDTENPSTDYLIEIRRRRTVDAKNPETDPVIESLTIQLDADGYTEFKWRPSNTMKFMGPNFRYYPKITSVADSTRWCVHQSIKDIKVYGRINTLVDIVDLMLGPIQAIPIYDLKSKDSNFEDRQDFRFTYGNWRLDYDPIVYLADDSGENVVSNYTVNYEDGIVTFPEDIPAYKDVVASFSLKLFDDNTIKMFLAETLKEMNYIPPVTKDTLENYPDSWEPFITQGATVKALSRMRTETLFRERRLIFSSAQIVNQLSGYEENLKKAFDLALTKKNRWGRTQPHAITGYDVIAPPRVTPQNFAAFAYLRGRAI